MMRSMVSSLVVFVLALVALTTADNLALLSGTLRTYQRAGCDDEMVTLRCPPGTGISIDFAHYGKTAPVVCNSKTTQASIISGSYNYNISCVWQSAAQSGNWDEATRENWGKYSLLQTVVETCQKKRQCKFQTSPRTFGGDPCPGIRKYVEVAYKCRPYVFRSKVACQNDRIQLKCNPNSRVAVFSASYGRTEYESVQCPQPQGVPEETCLVSYATETVINLCHGKRSCEVSADTGTFGSPCRPDSRMYLKVVYTCVPRMVLKEEYEGQLEPDEAEFNTHVIDDEDGEVDYDSGKEYIRESAASPSASNADGDGKTENQTKTNVIPESTDLKRGPGAASLDPLTTPRNTHSYLLRPSRVPAIQKSTISKGMRDVVIPSDPNCTIVTVVAGEKDDNARVIGFVTEWINAYTFVSQNQERFYLYLIISIAAGLLLCLTLLVARLLVQRHRARREAKFHATNVVEHTLPNGFTDDISEVDADIDLTTPLPIPSITVHSPVPVSSIAEVVRYPHGHTHTLRRMPETDAPRSLSTASNSHYYYG